jgi:hypothetical protein
MAGRPTAWEAKRRRVGWSGTTEPDTMAAKALRRRRCQARTWRRPAWEHGGILQYYARHVGWRGESSPNYRPTRRWGRSMTPDARRREESSSSRTGDEGAKCEARVLRAKNPSDLKQETVISSSRRRTKRMRERGSLPACAAGRSKCRAFAWTGEMNPESTRVVVLHVALAMMDEGQTEKEPVPGGSPKARGSSNRSL